MDCGAGRLVGMGYITRYTSVQRIARARAAAHQRRRQPRIALQWFEAETAPGLRVDRLVEASNAPESAGVVTAR